MIDKYLIQQSIDGSYWIVYKTSKEGPFYSIKEITEHLLYLADLEEREKEKVIHE